MRCRRAKLACTLRSCTARGEWVALAGDPETLDFAPPPGHAPRRRAGARRRAASATFSINDSDSLAGDMRKYVRFWGIAPVAEAAGVHLYRIE